MNCSFQVHSNALRVDVVLWVPTVNYSLRIVFLFKILLFSLQKKKCETLELGGKKQRRIVKRGFPTKLKGEIIIRGFPTKPRGKKKK